MDIFNDINEVTKTIDGKLWRGWCYLDTIFEVEDELYSLWEAGFHARRVCLVTGWCVIVPDEELPAVKSWAS